MGDVSQTEQQPVPTVRRRRAARRAAARDLEVWTDLGDDTEPNRYFPR